MILLIYFHMPMKKTLLALGLGVSILFGTAGAFAAEDLDKSFADVPANHWAYESAKWGKVTGLVQGQNNDPNVFDPSGQVNRAQLITVMKRMYDFISSEFNQKLANLASTSQEMKVTQGFMIQLRGQQQVPSVTTTGSGTGYLMLTDEGLRYFVRVENMGSGISAAHIHMGEIGENGTERQSIPMLNGVANGLWPMSTLTTEDMSNLLAGKMYIDVHTTGFSNGEIRGQILPVASHVFTGALSPEQEPSDVASGGNGTAHYVLVGNSLFYHISFQNLTGEMSAAHIHGGMAGANGGVLHELECNKTNRDCAGVWMNMSEQNMMDLKMGQLYANIHTPSYTGGEIRGQIFLMN